MNLPCGPAVLVAASLCLSRCSATHAALQAVQGIVGCVSAAYGVVPLYTSVRPLELRDTGTVTVAGVPASVLVPHGCCGPPFC